jgi:hypothetical protein
MRVRGRVDGLVASLAAGLVYAWVSSGGTLVGETFKQHRWAETSAWARATVLGAPSATRRDDRVAELAGPEIKAGRRIRMSSAA